MSDPSVDGGVNARLLRGALLVVASGFFAYLAVQFFHTMLFRHVLDELRGADQPKWGKIIPAFTDTAIELVIVGGLVVSTIAVWRSRGPARFLLTGAAFIQLLATILDLAFTFIERDRVNGVDWMTVGVFGATLVTSRCLLTLGVRSAVKSAHRSMPWPLWISTIAAVLVGQGGAIYRATMMAGRGPGDALPSVLWFNSNSLGFGLLVALVLTASAKLSVDPGRSPWSVAAKGFASLRSMAITRLAVGISFGVIVQICIVAKSFGAAYWLLSLLLLVSIALGYWGVFATANTSALPRARVAAFFSSGLFIASLQLDYAASRRVGDMLNAVRTNRLGLALDALGGVPTLVLVAGLIQVVATALLFRTIALGAFDRGLAETRSDANRGMWLSIVASLLATIVNAGRSDAKPWFGLGVIVPLGIVALVLAIMSFTAFLRTTQALSIALPDE